MRRVVVLGAIAAALTACGSSATGHTPIVFGTTGGNMVGYRVSIEPNGSVRINGSGLTSRRHISPAHLRNLRREIQQAHLANRRCPGVLPDIVSRYIRVGGRTVTVHGTCDQGFQRVWNDLLRGVAFGRRG